MRTKAKNLNSQLPATPCTEDMRERVVSLAQSKGQSIAELQREALSLFLRRFERSTVNTDSQSIKEKVS